MQRGAIGRATCAVALGTLAIGAPGIVTRAPALSLATTAFQPDGDIPAKYTCDGSVTAQERRAQDTNAAVSPALTWHDPPNGTKAFALVVDDPDAPGGSWVHWVLFDIPASARALPEGVERQPTLADGTKQGRNNYGNLYYQGPCPPRGDKPHHYHFTLYALDAPSGLAAGPPGVSKGQLLQAITKHTLGKADLVGRYQR